MTIRWIKVLKYCLVKDFLCTDFYISMGQYVRFSFPFYSSNIFNYKINRYYKIMHKSNTSMSLVTLWYFLWHCGISCFSFFLHQLSVVSTTEKEFTLFITFLLPHWQLYHNYIRIGRSYFEMSGLGVLYRRNAGFCN